MGNREALLDGALECLLEKGYARTTARDVAGRAGTSLAAIGYHFRSTQQLLHEAIAEGFRQWRAGLASVLEEHADGTPEELVAAVGDELTRLFKEQRPLFAVFLEALALAERDDEVRRQAAADYQEDRVGTAALLGVMRGNPSDSDMTVASTVLAVVDGLFIQHLVSPSQAPSPRAVFDLLAPMMVNGASRSRRPVRAGRR